MPEAVDTYLKTQDFEQVRGVQKEILDAYVLDFAKHAPKEEVMKIMAVWDSIPNQLAKDNKKFIFSAIRKSARGMNMKSFALVVGEAYEFETTEIMQKRFGLEIGGVTPFLGLLFGLDIYFDEKILGCDKVLFGSGVPTESIRLNLKDLITIIQPNLVSISHIA
jgi:prolyl-tRNA editing enzyme YbaK/EbsC (Cys-tRNA(Pro) deacylase)